MKSFPKGEWDKEVDRQCQVCTDAALKKVNAAPIASSKKTADIQLQSTDLAPELSTDMPLSSNDTIRFAHFHISQVLNPSQSATDPNIRFGDAVAALLETVYQKSIVTFVPLNTVEV